MLMTKYQHTEQLQFWKFLDTHPLIAPKQQMKRGKVPTVLPLILKQQSGDHACCQFPYLKKHPQVQPSFDG